MAPHRNLQRKLLLVKLLQNSRRRRKEMQQKILFLLTVRRMLLLEVFFFLLFLFLPRKPLLIDHVDGFPVTRDGSKKYGTHTLIRGSRKRFVYQKPPLILSLVVYSTLAMTLTQHRRSLPRLPLHLVLYSQLVEYFRQKVVRLLMNYRTLQHCKPRRKEHANLHGKPPCLF